jgi:hypothetical protein
VEGWGGLVYDAIRRKAWIGFQDLCIIIFVILVMAYGGKLVEESAA